MANNLFIAGVPATGKSWLGSWLSAEQGYVHIDAERDGGRDFTDAGLHSAWDRLIETGQAKSFLTAVKRLDKPVVVNWGFPVRYLYVVSALQAEGVEAWWLNADRVVA